MRQRGRGQRDDGITTFVIALTLATCALLLWSTPVAAAASGLSGPGFAPSGAMAALMGVLVGVALKRRAR